MAQTDITTYAPILIWAFFLITLSFFLMNVKIFPIFLGKKKVFYKMKNILLLRLFLITSKIQGNEEYLLIKRLKTLLIK